MALSVKYTNPKGSQQAKRSPGAIFFTVLTGAGVYATPTGLAVDLVDILAQATTRGTLDANSVISITGRTTDGHTAIFTYSATTVWNMRLWVSGGTEIADGATTKTVECIMWLDGGSLP